MTIKLEINLTNKWLYSLIIIGVLFILSAGVWAYNSGQSPSIMGHSSEEIQGIPKIISGFLYTGDQIPLPQGYNESECQWIVSLKKGVQMGDYYAFEPSVNVTNDRVVHVTERGTSEIAGNGEAYYLVICQK